MEKPRVIMLKGLPASGKSTWAKQFVKDNPNFIRLNKDDIREMMGGYSKGKEDIVIAMRDEAIDDALIREHGVVVDDTNFEPRHEESIRRIAEFWRKEVEVKFFDVSLTECIERNSKRENPVPEQVIRDMAKLYNVGSPKLVQDKTKPNAFIFDIDGTLAKMNGRSPYDYSKVSTDLPNEPVIDVAQLLAGENHIIVVSGREGTKQCMEDTIKWLHDKEVFHTSLFMRAEGDERKDDVVKREILEKHILPNYYVRGVFDDRDRVVKMWREVGLQCYQVDYGNF